MISNEVRALSIRQPWVEAILSAAKTVENRTWTTPWRGWLVIHAAQRWDAAGQHALDLLGHPVDRDHAATGCYLGAVELVDVHADTGCCRPWGQPQQFHWQLRHPHRFAASVTGPGRLGLFRPRAELRAQFQLSEVTAR